MKSTTKASVTTKPRRGPTTLTPAFVIADPDLLGRAFNGTSWNTWRAVLKAAYAEPLSDDELALFRAVAGDRDPPTKRVRELIVIAGRRSGKDSIASAIATTASIVDYSKHLRPGERASVLCLAVDREQAKIVQRYIAGYFREIPLLRPFASRETDDGLILTNDVEISVATNSFRSVRGRTIACAIFDEAAFWRDDSSATPDVETYNAVLPGMITLPDAILVIITSAYRKAGLAYQKWAKHFGKADDDVLVVYGPSTAFNPSLPQSIIDAALERDPEAAGAEYMSVWRSDLSDFLDRELIDAAIDHGVVVRPPLSALRYSAFADPSGGRGDAFTLAIAHAEGKTAVLDSLYEKRAPFDPSVVVAEIASLLRSFGLAEVCGDKYAAQWVVEAFAKEGIAYRQAERDRSAIYLDVLPLFTAARVRLLDNARLTNQLASLERRTSRIGRDRVDHPPGGADDLANAAAGALVLTAASGRQTLWRVAALLANGAPVPVPSPSNLVFAVLIVDDCGNAAIAYFARNKIRGYPLVMLDCDLVTLSASLFDELAARLIGFASECNAPLAVLFTTRPLADEARRRGYSAEAADAIVAEGEDLAMSAAAHIASDRVKITGAVLDKTLQLPLGGVTDGIATKDDPLRAAALVGIAIALDENRELTGRAA